MGVVALVVGFPLTTAGCRSHAGGQVGRTTALPLSTARGGAQIARDARYVEGGLVRLTSPGCGVCVVVGVGLGFGLEFGLGLGFGFGLEFGLGLGLGLQSGSVSG